MNEDTTTEAPAKLLTEADFRHHTGSETWTRVGFRGANYIATDGVIDLATRCGAYWLLDVIVSYRRKLQFDELFTWEVRRTKTNPDGVTVTATLYDKVVIRQHVPYSDLRRYWDLDGGPVRIWQAPTDNYTCLYLPSEH